ARCLETLTVLSGCCRAAALKPEDVHPIASSATREASNRNEFLGAAEAQTGFEIEILSDEDEAFLGYVAAINTSTLTDGMVLEIGGGSLQLIHVAGRRARQLDSFPLGAVRLTEELLPGEGPAKKKELERVRARVRETLGELDWLGGERLVGLGGAVRNLAAAAQREGSPIDLGVQGFVITRDVLKGIVSKLAGMSASERGRVP